VTATVLDCHGLAEIAILTLYLALVPAVNAATGRCCQQGRLWTTATVCQVMTHRWRSAAVLIAREDEMFMIRSLNVTPTTTEQRI